MCKHHIYYYVCPHTSTFIIRCNHHRETLCWAENCPSYTRANIEVERMCNNCLRGVSLISRVRYGVLSIVGADFFRWLKWRASKAKEWEFELVLGLEVSWCLINDHFFPWNFLRMSVWIRVFSWTAGVVLLVVRWAIHSYCWISWSWIQGAVSEFRWPTSPCWYK